MDISEYSFFKALTALPFVEAIYLFGSRAKGEHDEWSDMDLAVACPGITREQWVHLQQVARTEEILVPVNLTRYDGTYNGALRAHIDQTKKVLYERHG